MKNVILNNIINKRYDSLTKTEMSIAINTYANLEKYVRNLSMKCETNKQYRLITDAFDNDLHELEIARYIIEDNPNKILGLGDFKLNRILKRGMQSAWFSEDNGSMQLAKFLIKNLEKIKRYLFKEYNR